MQMALLNSLYGDSGGGFGQRTVTLASSSVTMKPSPAPKPRKSSKRTSAKCAACGEVRSHAPQQSVTATAVIDRPLTRTRLRMLFLCVMRPLLLLGRPNTNTRGFVLPCPL